MKRIAALLLLALPSIARAESPLPVGMSGRIDVIVPGGELEAVPLEDRRSPVVLRIEAAEPTADGFHYRMVVAGLEAGEFDLRKYLRWKDTRDKSEVPDRPAWHVTVKSHLSPGYVRPHPLVPISDVRVGGYRVLLWVLGIGWGIGLLAIVLAQRRQRRQSVQESPASATLADRLQPLLERGMHGQLSEPERADLERTLIAVWLKRLHLEETDPLDAYRELRRHPDAGPLLTTLEDWLHRPPGSVREANLVELLRPYRETPADSYTSTGGHGK